jgi:hypothetical protein
MRRGVERDSFAACLREWQDAPEQGRAVRCDKAGTSWLASHAAIVGLRRATIAAAAASSPRSRTVFASWLRAWTTRGSHRYSSCASPPSAGTRPSAGFSPAATRRAAGRTDGLAMGAYSRRAVFVSLAKSCARTGHCTGSAVRRPVPSVGEHGLIRPHSPRTPRHRPSPRHRPLGPERHLPLTKPPPRAPVRRVIGPVRRGR